MKPICTVGLDLAKNVFQVHGAQSDGSPVFNRKLRRSEVLQFFEKLRPILSVFQLCDVYFAAWMLVANNLPALLV
jgi:transposase